MQKKKHVIKATLCALLSAKLFSEMPTTLTQPSLDSTLLPGKEIPNAKGNSHLSERSKNL